MKVLLVRLSYSHIYGVFPGLPKKREIRPPLGLLCLADALEMEAHQVTVLDAEPLLLSVEEVARIATDYDVLGVTATTPEFHEASTLCLMVKGHNPNILTVMGGAHVSALPNESLRDWIDYIVVGEGESTLGHILRNRPLNRIIAGVDAALSFSRPARHLLDYQHYHFAAPDRGLIPMDVIESSRGCPFGCTFCYNRRKPPRYKDPRQVVSEIKSSVEKRGTKLFMFLDDTLTLNKEHVLTLCDEIQRADLDVCFYGNARANCADLDMLKAMRAAGFVELSMGIESGNQHILDTVKKGTRLDQYRLAYIRMHRLGFQTRGSFILGLPGETHETVRASIDFAKELDLMRISCNVLMPYPGTELLEQAKRGEGLHLLTEDWRDYKRWGDCVARTDELSCEELVAYQRQFIKEFYLQPKILHYHVMQWLKGNRDYFYYRPLLFALNEAL